MQSYQKHIERSDIVPVNTDSILYFILDNYKNYNELKDLSSEEIENLKQINNNIKKEQLYHFEYHGLHHSQKVMIFAYLIGKHENINNEDMKILIDAAIYHDIGRVNEFEETT